MKHGAKLSFSTQEINVVNAKKKVKVQNQYFDSTILKSIPPQATPAYGVDFFLFILFLFMNNLNYCESGLDRKAIYMVV